MKLLRTLRRMRNTAEPLIMVRIRREAILGNYRAFKKSYGVPVAPVLKSNAYGHGLLEVAGLLEAERPPFIVVDSLHEAAQLRSGGITTSLLVIGYVRTETIAGNRYRDVAFTITSLDGLKRLVAQNVRAEVHIKIDTGMRRQGIVAGECDEAARLLEASRLDLIGLCSHFADADGEHDSFTRSQITAWNRVATTWRAQFPQLRYFHLAATAGAAFSKDIDANIIRTGTGLYGFPRHQSQTFDLLPALSMRSVITGVKDLAAGESVGYNCTFTAEKSMRIATIPVGYFEGIDRRLSNKGSALIGGVLCPIVGRVSMNITTIDVSNCEDARLETPVTVFSDRNEDPNSFLSLAALCDTTPLELLVHIPQHLRRVLV